MIMSHKKIQFNKKVKELKEAQDIQHFIIIPNYKEPITKLRSSIKSVVNNDIPYKNLSLVLAFEDREEEAREKEQILKKEFKEFFKEILVSYHTLGENEVVGKASNQAFAARIVDAQVEKNKLDRKKVIITIADADSHFPKNYFSYLTYEYVKDTDRIYHFYWAPVLLYNNFWQLPFFVKMQATLSSVSRLAFLSQKDKLIQISTYSTSLWLLKQVDFWDVDIIPEDWHIYYQAFFKFGEKVQTMPLYTFVNGDAVYSGGLIRTIKNRYEQERRWAWGVSDIGYALRHFFIAKHIKPLVKIKKIAFLIENHLLWPTTFFILTLSGYIPSLVNPVFGRTNLGFNLSTLTSLVLTMTSAMLALYVYLDIKIRNEVGQKTKSINIPFLIAQWYLLPVVSFILSALPALDAHTRMILGKKLDYKVTEKV